MKINLVYAFHPGSDQTCSPFCITNYLYKYLSERAEVTYDVWDSMNIPKADPESVFLGHPNYDPNTIVQQVFRRNIEFRAKCTIHPFHHQMVEANWPFNDISMAADKIFSICGPYWYDTIENTVFRDWKPKMVRLDMAVDCNIWKYRKRKFNDVGKRGIVYIGAAKPEKNLAYLYQIARDMPNVRFRWYGGYSDHPINRLPNVETIGWTDFRNEQVLEELYNFADIFLNVSISDANPTTLLEFGLAGGLIPICTETSGYWRSPAFINIPHVNTDAIKIINHWLHEPTEKLAELSASNRVLCEKEYTWDKFCSTVWNEINKFF